MKATLVISSVAAIAFVSLAVPLTATAAPAVSPTPTPAPAAAPTATATPSSGLEQMSLEDLLDVDISVATKQKGQTIRQAPGVITLVTHDDIVNSGARDLIDVMQMVPGFSFATDVGGVVGTGFRGNWGHEGKVLWLVDGQMLNELLYSNDYLGHEFPVDQIEKIEVIRGPGSVVYGGLAELAVINIVTRSADMNGGEIATRFGQMDSAPGQADVEASWGKVLDSGLALSVALMGGRGQRSDRTFTDFYGSSYSMRGNSDLNPSTANFGLAYKGLTARILLDDYAVGTRDGYTNAYGQQYKTRFTTYQGTADYALKLSDSLTITPHVGFQHEIPWQVTVADGTAPTYDKIAERITGGLSASWDATKDVNLLVGWESYNDHAWLTQYPAGVGYQTSLANGNAVDYRNIAGYAQVLYTGKIADVSLGARAERHSAFGNSFVPRAAITKEIGRAHFKALYSRAFRAPAIENVSINPQIKPETTTDIEVEAGYKVTDKTILTANAFDLTIKNPIVYAAYTSNQEGYFNFNHTGSRGAELTLQSRADWGSLNATFSYATIAGKNDVDLYRVDGQKNWVLGMPQVKVTGAATFIASPGVTVTPSVVYLGPEYGYLTGDGAGNGVLGIHPSTMLVNLWLNSREVLHPGLEAGVGVYNLLDANWDFIQAYNSGHAPIPGASREFAVRFAYRF